MSVTRDPLCYQRVLGYPFYGHGVQCIGIQKFLIGGAGMLVCILRHGDGFAARVCFSRKCDKSAFKSICIHLDSSIFSLIDAYIIMWVLG